MARSIDRVWHDQGVRPRGIRTAGAPPAKVTPCGIPQAEHRAPGDAPPDRSAPGESDGESSPTTRHHAGCRRACRGLPVPGLHRLPRRPGRQPGHPGPGPPGGRRAGLPARRAGPAAAQPGEHPHRGHPHGHPALPRRARRAAPRRRRPERLRAGPHAEHGHAAPSSAPSTGCWPSAAPPSSSSARRRRTTSSPRSPQPRHDVPVIVADRHVDLPQLDAIRIDDTAAMMMLVGHLAGLGHTEIWHAAGTGYVSADPRLDGYLTAMARHGLADAAHVVRDGRNRPRGRGRRDATARLGHPPHRHRRLQRPRRLRDDRRPVAQPGPGAAGRLRRGLRQHPRGGDAAHGHHDRRSSGPRISPAPWSTSSSSGSAATRPPGCTSCRPARSSSARAAARRALRVAAG